MFQHTAARRRLGPNIRHPTSPPPCFNTQPPEGGWYGLVLPVDHDIWFQHTAARRRLDFRRWVRQHNKFVSTHSRPKAAGLISLIIVYPVRVSTHSRPKAAGTAYQRQQTQVQFQHTAARRRLVRFAIMLASVSMFQHTAARRRLDNADFTTALNTLFQHTAARRRLGCSTYLISIPFLVSTHSRPKAAGPSWAWCNACFLCFNTQPPEGGWGVRMRYFWDYCVSTHSRPKAAG